MWHRVVDRASLVLSWVAALGVAGLFFWIAGQLVLGGWEALSWEFLTASPRDSGRAGGIAPMLVATSWILGLALLIALPLGLGTAMLLSELTREEDRLGRWVRRSLDVLAGIPSIVFGLFGYAFFSKILGLGFSILSGGLTLACMILPILIRATEEGFRAVPDDYRMGAAALGLSRSTTLFRLVVPSALPGLVAGVVLGSGRALAETAALLFTSGYVDRMPGSLFDSGRALSIHIFDLAMNVPGGNRNAYASALVLLTLVLLVNSAARLLFDPPAGRSRLP